MTRSGPISLASVAAASPPSAETVERSFFWQPGLAQAIDNSSATVTDEQRRECKEKYVDWLDDKISPPWAISVHS